MEDCLVTVRVRNNRIVKAIERSGYASQRQFCISNNIIQTVLSSYVNFKCTPVSKLGGWKGSATMISSCLGVSEEDLFPEFTREAFDVNEFDFEINVNDVQKLNYSKDIEMDSNLLQEKVVQYVDSLRDREAKVIKYFYGVGVAKKNYKEIGAELNISSERVAQIAQGAIRKLRRGLVTTDRVGFCGKLEVKSELSLKNELEEIYKDVESYGFNTIGK